MCTRRNEKKTDTTTTMAVPNLFDLSAEGAEDNDEDEDDDDDDDGASTPVLRCFRSLSEVKPIPSEEITEMMCNTSRSNSSMDKNSPREDLVGDELAKLYLQSK